jgi:D-glycero-D-manno-heptose 1,7-bisphosphate phosphatase
MNKCIFLDRDGVLNQEIGGYVFKAQDLSFTKNMAEALKILKSAGFLLIVVTNQAGIAKGLYSREDVRHIHNLIQEECGHLIDDLYFSPHHPDYSSQTLLRKPSSLMIEKAMAKYQIDPNQSWMIGDRPRDIESGQKAGLRTIFISEDCLDKFATFSSNNLLDAAHYVISQN